MKKLCLTFLHGTKGQDLIEYALLAAAIALGVLAGMTVLKTGINNEFSTLSTSLGS
jgi:Flp pilus assembly pilin Flp